VACNVTCVALISISSVMVISSSVAIFLLFCYFYKTA